MLSKELTQPGIFRWNTAAKVQVNLFVYFVTAPAMINIESAFLFIGYMNAFDRTAMHAVIYITT